MKKILLIIGIILFTFKIDGQIITLPPNPTYGWVKNYITTNTPFILNGSEYYTNYRLGLGTTNPNNNYNMTISKGGLYFDRQNYGYNNIYISVPDSIILNGSTNTGTDLEFTHTYEAYKFTPASTIDIQSFSIFMKKSGTLSNLIAYTQMYVYTDDAGEPGTQIGTISEKYRYGSLTDEYQEIFTQTTPQELNSGTSYWLVVVRSESPSGGTIYLDTDNEGVGKYAYSSNGSSWTVADNVTGRFNLYAITESGLYITGSNWPSIDVYNNTEYGIRATSNYDYAGLFIGHNNGALSCQSNYGPSILGWSDYNFAARLWSDHYTSLYSYTNSRNSNNYGAWIYNYGAGAGMYCGSDSLYGGYYYSKLENALYANTSANAASSKSAGYFLNSGSGYGSSSISVGGYGARINTTTGIPLYMQNYPSSTNTITTMANIYRFSSGTAANGIGQSIDFYIQENSGGSELAGRITTKLTDVANNAEYGQMILSTVINSTITDVLIIKSSGTINLPIVPVYADNAAALLGGLVAGDVYRKSTGELMIVYE